MTDETAPLEEIPSKYSTTRLKYVVERQTDKFDDVPEGVPRITLDMVESWTGKVNKNGDDENASSDLVKFNEGDVLFNKLRPYLAKAFLAENHGAASPEFIVLRPTESNARYLLYLLLSREFIDRVNTSTYGARMPRASWEFISNIQIPCPAEGTQRTIAEFLDYHTSLIEKLVEKNVHLRGLLEEKQEVVITQAVTKGLDKNVELVDPGIDLLGQIPEHWEVVRLKFLLDRIEQGWSPPSGNNPAAPDEWGVLKAGAAKNGRFSPNENKYLPSDITPQPEYEIQSGDLLMNRASGSRDLIGSVALVRDVPSRLLLCDKLFRLHVREELVRPKFLFLSLRSHTVRHQIAGAISGASGLANNLPQSKVKELALPLPPLSEQERIAQKVLAKEQSIDNLLEDIGDNIDLLQEKRQALITNAVTGQIDLSDWELPDDQEPPP